MLNRSGQRFRNSDHSVLVFLKLFFFVHYKHKASLFQHVYIELQSNLYTLYFNQLLLRDSFAYAMYGRDMYGRATTYFSSPGVL